MRTPNRGFVLVVVLFFALLLASSIATFTRKALIDHMIVRNRDARARAEALARGGVRLATALLLEDKYRALQTETPVDNRGELWAQVSGRQIPLEDGSTLELDIEDAASRLNLNAVIVFDDSGNPDPRSAELITRLLEKAIDEIPVPPAEKRYDPAQLAANLIDYVDEDSVSQSGEPEDDAYQQRDPPTRPSNRPLLSVDELRRVEGFDAPLVEALRPYVTVYPYAQGGGINPNTAPPHVLALLFFDDEVSLRLADEDTIRSLLNVRQDGGWVCGEDQSAEGCTPIRSIVTNAIFPEPSFRSDVFIVTVLARVGDVESQVEAVLDIANGASPQLLSWRIR